MLFHSVVRKSVLKVIKIFLVSIKRIVFLLSLLMGFAVSAHQSELGLPYSETISPFFIGYEGPWGTVAQDSENVLCFENSYGIVTFDGAAWKLYPTHGAPKLYQTQNGEIYFGAIDYIGKFGLNDENQAGFVSVLKDSTFAFGRVSDIEMFNNQLYFVANSKLYGIQDGIPNEVVLGNPVEKIFVDRNVLYVASGKVLYEYSKNLNLIAQYPLEVQGTVRTDECLVFAAYDGLYKISTEKKVVRVETEIDEILKNGDFSCLARMANNTICLGTHSNGLFCLDMQGKIIFSLNVSNGFPDNDIEYVFVDNTNNVWATTHTNIIRVDMSSAITYFNKNNGLLGNVTCVLRVNEVLYAGTDRGVFRLNDNHFEQILKQPCNALVEYKKSLIAGTTKGLFNVTTGEHICINNIKNLYPYKKGFISISESMLSVWMESRDTYPSFLPKYQVSLPNIEVTTMALEDAEKHVVFLGTKSDGLWFMQFDSTKNNLIKKCDWPGLPKGSDRLDVFKTSFGSVISTSNGIYRCDVDNKFFYKDSRILLPSTEKKMWASPITEDDEKNLWMVFHNEGVYENQIAVAWYTNNSEHYTLITAPFLKVRKNHTISILTEDNFIVWMGGNTGLVRLDFNKISIKKKVGNVRFTEILVDDRVVAQTDETVVLPYDTKSIIFDFMSVEFDNHEEMYYSYYLEGQERLWSNPTKINKKEYTNLPAGKYVFHIRAKRPGGAVSKESTFSFEVKQHPLLSSWAILFYIIVIAAIILVSYSRMRPRVKRVIKRKIAAKTANAAAADNSKKENAVVEKEDNESVFDMKPTGMRSMNFDIATVLFSDFKGFTKIAERIAADSLINELEKYFAEFDSIVEKYNVAKIKTVGDSYMCAGGIPKSNTTNPIEVVAAALEIQYRMEEMQKDNQDGEAWGVRIGVHTGPVIAGLVGSKKYTYDIWGESVNIANRMEASGEVGRVNISESTFLMVREFFDCEYRGKVALKGKEEKMDMYFVNGFKAVFTDNPLKALPNTEFANKLALQRFEGLQEQIYTMLEEKLPSIYFYHNLKHTIDVVVQVEAIGYAEGVNDVDMYILKTAALFHDAGFIRSYQKHEQAGMELARAILPNEGYTQDQIDRICHLIDCTRTEVVPEALLEKILCDADLDYLGRSDYYCVSNELYKELLEQKLVKKNEYEWYLTQVKFLQEHKYYTDFSRSRRNPEKVKHIQWLQEQITNFNNINSKI